MVDLHAMRTFRLVEGGVECDARGLSVGSVTLLSAAPGGTLRRRWSVRAEDEMNRELSSRYRLPVDVSGKMRGLQSVAEALNDGDLARAGIAALMLRFPDPPSLSKGAPDEVSFDLATALWESGLLKGDWDPTKHPRTGTPPNPGWFAPTPSAPISEEQGLPTAFGYRRRAVSQFIRGYAAFLWRKAAFSIPTLAETGGGLLAEAGAALATDGLSFLAEFLADMAPTELNKGEQRILDEIRASADPPKSLEQLRFKPNENVLGYNNHHNVEQNPANVEKTEAQKFTQERLDQQDNLVWIPTLKHERITAWYNSTDTDDPQRRIRRVVISEKSWDEQRAIGLERLQAEGILQ